MPSMNTPLLDEQPLRQPDSETKGAHKACTILSYVIYILCIAFCIVAITVDKLFVLNETFIYIIAIGISAYGLSQTLFGSVIKCYANRNFRFDEQALAIQRAKDGSFELNTVNDVVPPPLPSRSPVSVMDSIVNGLSSKRTQNITSDHAVQTLITTPFNLHLHHQNVQLRPNCSVLTNIRIGDIEHQLQLISTKQLSLMLPVMYAYIKHTNEQKNQQNRIILCFDCSIF